MEHTFVDSLSHALPHSHTLTSRHNHDSEWEAKEQLRLRELEEARTRATQMEKTMRWWSDCTANWREKWSKVRTERNKAREEVRLLRTKYEVIAKENFNLKREKQELESELDRVKRGDTMSLSRDIYQDSRIHSLPERDVSAPCTDLQRSLLMIKEDGNFNSTHDSGLPCISQSSTDLKFFDHMFQSSSEENLNKSDANLSLDISRMSIIESPQKSRQFSSWEDSMSPDAECMKQRLSEIELKLEEVSKTVQLERDENLSLHKVNDKLQQEHSELKLKYEELKAARQETIKEISQLKSEHQDEIDSLRLDMEDEVNTRSSLDRKLCELRSQLERLQTENATEWGKRERLETEKLSLERENKKLRSQIEEFQDRLERKTKNTGGGVEVDSRALQHEIYDKNKELSDLRHAHCKLKMVLQEKSTELGHASRRAEQYETEVKKLRCRVEELKKELATAEDEIDSSANTIRKMQRTNDELQEQVDNLQMQVDHLQTRLRNNSHSLLALRGSNCLLNDGFSEDDNAEF